MRNLQVPLTKSHKLFVGIFNRWQDSSLPNPEVTEFRTAWCFLTKYLIRSMERVKQECTSSLNDTVVKRILYSAYLSS
jgi:hypothetical protein